MVSKAMRTRGRSGKAPRHVRLYHWMLGSAAWQSLSPNARAVYVEIAARYAGPASNNGRIPYSVRDARSMSIGKTAAALALAQLQDRGFIAPVTKGAFSLKLCKATEWRLTEFPCDVTKLDATKDFMKWRPEIQNAVPVVRLTVLPRGPLGPYGETAVTKSARFGA